MEQEFLFRSVIILNVKLETIEKFCCPYDKQDLWLKIILKDEQQNILKGWLNCAACHRIYPIIKGIPIMNPDEYREANLEQPVLDRWQKQLQGKDIKDFRFIDRPSNL